MNIYIDGMKVPVNPETIKLTDSQGIDTVNILDLGSVPIVKYAELQTIEFESFVPGSSYDGVYGRSGYITPERFVSTVQQLKNSGSPIQLLIGGAFGSAINAMFLIQNFDVGTKTGYEEDVLYTIKFIQYRPYAPRAVSIKDKKALMAVKSKPKPEQPAPRQATSSKPVQKTHTVVSGDTLWAIAQANYGDGSQYMRIVEANRDKIRDPHWIYPGQVFVIP